MKRLLIVDDEPDLLESLAMALEGLFEVRTAANGKLALDQLAAERFDAILLDLMMPVMSGDQVIRALAGRPHPPIIVSSAGRNLEETCAELGIRHVLAKPYRLPALLAMLEAAIAGDGGAQDPENRSTPTATPTGPDGTGTPPSSAAAGATSLSITSS